MCLESDFLLKLFLELSNWLEYLLNERCMSIPMDGRYCCRGLGSRTAQYIKHVIRKPTM